MAENKQESEILADQEGATVRVAGAVPEDFALEDTNDSIEPVFGEVPDDVQPPYDLDSYLFEDFINRYPFLVIQQDLCEIHEMPPVEKKHDTEGGWEISQHGKVGLSTSAGEHAWVDYASIDMHQGQPVEVALTGLESSTYYAMKDQACLVKWLGQAGATVTIAGLDWHHVFEDSETAPEFIPKAVGQYAIEGANGESLGELVICEPKVLPARQGTLQAQTDKTIDAMVALAKKLKWSEIRVKAGNERSLFSLWVAGKLAGIPVNGDDVGYHEGFESRFAVISEHLAQEERQTTQKKKSK